MVCARAWIGFSDRLYYFAHKQRPVKCLLLLELIANILFLAAIFRSE